MRKRCTNPNDSRWSDYGGRGITICERWNTFENFIADMGALPTPSHSIERRDNAAGYSPSNCFWATPVEQARNRRDVLTFTYLGETRALTDWCERLGLDYARTYMRIHRNGYTFEEAVSLPPRPRLKTIKARQQP